MPLRFALPPLSPSPDPVSLAFDAVSTFVTIFMGFQARKNARQAQENEVVAVQNRLNDAMAPISEAAQSADVTLPELVELSNQLSQLGEDFYNYTLEFSIAGPGARTTIFGAEVAPGQFEQTAAAPGYLTGLLDYIKRKIIEMSGGAVQAQLGFDWERFLSIGADVFDQITGRRLPPVRPLPPYPTTTPVPTTTYYPPASMPSWLLPALIVGGAFLLLRNK